MLKAIIGTEKGERSLILGLEPENITRLQAGKPISIKGAELGLSINIVIFAGKSIEAMTEELLSVVAPGGEG